jgi:hypothetical protein
MHINFIISGRAENRERNRRNRACDVYQKQEMHRQRLRRLHMKEQEAAPKLSRQEQVKINVRNFRLEGDVKSKMNEMLSMFEEYKSTATTCSRSTVWRRCRTVRIDEQLNDIASPSQRADFLAKRLTPRTLKHLKRTPNRGGGRPRKLVDEVEELCVEFWRDDKISRCMPGKKRHNLKKVKLASGENGWLSKRVLYANCRTVYDMFCAKHPGVRMSFTTFYRTKPSEIVFAKMSHRMVCGCVYCINASLLRKALGKASTDEMLNAIRCDRHSGSVEQLDLNDCQSCLSKIETWQHQVSEIEGAEFSQIEAVLCGNKKYPQFVQSKDVDKLRTVMKKSLPFLLKHIQLIKSQHNAYSEVNQQLRPGELQIIGDYSENYQIITPCESQSMHFGKRALSLYTAVCNFVTGKNQMNEEVHLIFSAQLEKNNATVEAIHTTIRNEIEQQHEVSFERVFEHTDGCSVQYKCSAVLGWFANESHSSGVKIMRHYFESGHGKSKDTQ